MSLSNSGELVAHHLLGELDDFFISFPSEKLLIKVQYPALRKSLIACRLHPHRDCRADLYSPPQPRIGAGSGQPVGTADKSRAVCGTDRGFRLAQSAPDDQPLRSR
jgi:hypothetical protein